MIMSEKKKKNLSRWSNRNVFIFYVEKVTSPKDMNRLELKSHPCDALALPFFLFYKYINVILMPESIKQH